MKQSDDRPVLSVCVPTRNRGPWLAERLRAALRLAPGALEIVVSDNASADGSAAVAAIDHPRLRLVRNRENVGAFENQLRAFEAASGRYVMQLMDKDELVPEGIAGGVEELSRLDVACGEFALNCADPGPTELRRGFAAFRRYALRFTHPSGRFFSAAVLREHGLLAKLRGLDPVIRPYSTDYLVALSLAHGSYAEINRPLVRMNLPPYPGLSASTSYRDPADYYFTPEFIVREFAAFVRLLRSEAPFGALSRLRLVAHLAGGTVFDQMTSWYRWRLESGPMCAWYGVSPEFRAGELARDLTHDAAALLGAVEGIGRAERSAVRLAVARRVRRGEWHPVPSRIGGEG